MCDAPAWHFLIMTMMGGSTLLLNGSTVPAQNGKEPPPRAMLFHNRSRWDVSGTSQRKAEWPTNAGDSESRLATTDNDGWADLYVANFGKNRLYHNNREGVFSDLTEKAGVALGGWSTGNMGRL